MPYKDEKGKKVDHVAYPNSKRGDAFCSRTQKVRAPGGGMRKLDCAGDDKGSKACDRRKAWGCKGAKSNAKPKGKKK